MEENFYFKCGDYHNNILKPLAERILGDNLVI